MLTVQYETVVAAVALLLVGTAVQLGISDLVAGAVMQLPRRYTARHYDERNSAKVAGAANF